MNPCLIRSFPIPVWSAVDGEGMARGEVGVEMGVAVCGWWRRKKDDDRTIDRLGWDMGRVGRVGGKGD